MPDTLRRIFTATLILGVPGAGKTSLLATFATYLWDTYRRVLLLYSWDGGAIPTELQRLMKQGLIRFWRVRTRSAEGLGIETLYLATKGYWPRQINAETGETSPAVDLVPPVTTAYTASCKQGHVLGRLPVRSTIAPAYCDACKTIVPVSEMTIAETVTRTKGFELVGGVAFDGLTSMTGVVMEHMDHARGRGDIGGEKPAFGGIVVSGSVKLGGNNRADVGFGQTRGQQFVNNSLSIPHLVEGPVFTALSMEATDEGGLPIVGAKLPGRAATDEASAWFGNVFEMGRSADDRGLEHFTLFLRPFTDPQNRRHLLKTSASPTGLPDRLTDPIGTPWSQANLGLVYTMLDEDLRRALAQEIAGAPGLSGTPSEYGDPFFVAPTTPAPVAAATIPPLGPPPAAPPTAPAPTITGPAVGGVPPAVVARKRTPRVEETPAAPIAPTTTTTTTPTTTPTPPPTTTAAAPPPPGAPPPPPGMKPPARMPAAG